MVLIDNNQVDLDQVNKKYFQNSTINIDLDNDEDKESVLEQDKFSAIFDYRPSEHTKKSSVRQFTKY